MNVLEAKDLSFAYGNTPVLDAASFTMCEGGFAARRQSRCCNRIGLGHRRRRP